MLAAPATVNLSANAADSDGTMSRVEFYRDTTLIQTVTSPSSGTPSSGTWTYSDTNVGAGIYGYTAKAYDNLNAVTTSTPAATVNVTAGGAGERGVAGQRWGCHALRAIHGGALQQHEFPASAANNGDRKGVNWNDGGDLARCHDECVSRLAADQLQWGAQHRRDRRVLGAGQLPSAGRAHRRR